MVKLHREVSYMYKGHEIWRYRIIIPRKIVAELNWKIDNELELKVKNNKLEIVSKV